MIPKFRAWLKEEKKMIEPSDILSISFKLCEMTPNYLYGFEKEKYDFYDLELMQSTGLEDKNNKEIFEGDIVRMRNPRDRRQIGMFQVVRVANSPMLGLLDKKLTTEIFNLYEHMRNYYEIIGNIHENPELLEVTK